MKKLLTIVCLLFLCSCICLKKEHKPRRYPGEYQVVLYMDTTWIYDGHRLVRRFVDTAANEYRKTFEKYNN